MIIYHSIHQFPISSNAISVFTFLKNRAGKKQDCYPSISFIGNNLHISRSTVIRALNELEKEELIQRKARFRKNGGRSSTLYILTKVDL